MLLTRGSKKVNIEKYVKSLIDSKYIIYKVDETILDKNIGDDVDIICNDPNQIIRTLIKVALPDIASGFTLSVKYGPDNSYIHLDIMKEDKIIIRFDLRTGFSDFKKLYVNQHLIPKLINNPIINVEGEIQYNTLPKEYEGLMRYIDYYEYHSVYPTKIKHLTYINQKYNDTEIGLIIQMAQRYTDCYINTMLLDMHIKSERVKNALIKKINHRSSRQNSVDVIIPTYNCARYIKDAIKSVLQQKEVRKIFVIDDGSNDDTEQVISEIKKNSKKIVYVKQKNCGLSNARNTGIKLTSAEYVALLDADDVWLPGKLNAQLTKFRTSKYRNLGVVYCEYNDMDEQGRILLNYQSFRLRKEIKGNVYKKLLQCNYIAGSGSAVLVKRKCFMEVGLFDEDLGACEDWDMWLRLSSIYEFDYVSRKFVTLRRRHSSMQANRRHMIMNTLLFITKLPDKGRSLSTDMRESISRELLTQILSHPFDLDFYKRLIMTNKLIQIKDLLWNNQRIFLIDVLNVGYGIYMPVINKFLRPISNYIISPFRNYLFYPIIELATGSIRNRILRPIRELLLTPSMVTVHISGGLGNQMFQYAAGFALAKKLDTTLTLDTSSFLRDPQGRKFGLNKYNTTARVHSPLAAYIKKKLSRNGRIFAEKNNQYDPKLLHQPENTYLLGHWQSEKYFKKHASLIRNELRYTQPLSITAQSLYNKIKSNKRSVSIHIRRGDYVTNKAASDVLGVLPLSYYKKAVKIIASKIVNPTYYIFSDDQKWVSENILIKNAMYVDTGSSHEDLELMRACHHHIIANSSFSWWGAWLGKYRDQIVIAPQKWFKDHRFSTNDLIPPGWIQI